MKSILTKPSEHQEQCAVFSWAAHNSAKYPELRFMFGTLNGVRLQIGQATKAKKAGNKRGVPDIILPYNNGKYNGLFIELKIPGNKPSKEQMEYINFLRSQNYFADVRVGSVEAINLIIDYMEKLV